MPSRGRLLSRCSSSSTNTTAARLARRMGGRAVKAPVYSPSGVCRARLCDCREIGSGDLRLQVPPGSVRCFVVAPFDVLASRFDQCGHATIGGRWPGHPVSLASDFRLEQPWFLPGEDFLGNLPKRLIRLRRPANFLHSQRGSIGLGQAPVSTHATRWPAMPYDSDESVPPTWENSVGEGCRKSGGRPPEQQSRRRACR